MIYNRPMRFIFNGVLLLQTQDYVQDVGVFPVRLSPLISFAGFDASPWGVQIVLGESLVMSEVMSGSNLSNDSRLPNKA